MEQVRVIVSATSGEATELVHPLNPDDFVGTLRDEAARALGVGLKQVKLIAGSVELNDDSCTLKEALGGRRATHVLIPAEIAYKDNVKVVEDGQDAFKVCATVQFPEPSDPPLKVNMMPIILGDPDSIPEECKKYLPLLDACHPCPPYERGLKGCVGYLTIDEGIVEPGKSQRRGGVHIESPGYLQSHISHKRRRTMFGSEDHFTGGICFASNVADTTAVWGVKIEDSGDVVRSGGDLEHLRTLLPEDKKRLLAPGELVWITDETPHESLPMTVTTKRQFFRLVAGSLSEWNAANNTSNPIGVTPCPFGANRTVTVQDNKHDPKYRPGKGKQELAVTTPAKSFYVKITKPDAKGKDLGLGMECESTASGKNWVLCVTYINPQGLIAEWNASHPQQAVKVWDIIVAVNKIGGRSHHLKEKLAARSQQSVEEVTFLRGLPFSTAPSRSQPPLPWEGLQLWLDAKDDASLVLADGPSKSGYVREWHCRAGTGHVLRPSGCSTTPGTGDELEVLKCSDGSIMLDHGDKYEEVGILLFDTELEDVRTEICMKYFSDSRKDWDQHMEKTAATSLSVYASTHICGSMRYGDGECKRRRSGDSPWTDNVAQATCCITHKDYTLKSVRNETYKSKTHVCELLTYNRALSDSEVDTIFSYLVGKWAHLKKTS